MRRALLVMLCLVGCDPGGVDLAVDVRTDLVPGLEVTRLVVALPDEESPSRDRALATGDATVPPLRVGEWMALAPGSRRLAVSALGPAGDVVARRTALIDHRASTLVTVVLARACGSRRCPDGEACVGGVCTDERCLTGAEPECTDDLCGACDPLSACDAPSCDDGVCLHDVDPSACGADERCAPAEGCLPAVAVDGGVDDAGPTDAGRVDAGIEDAGSAEGDAGAGDGGPPDAGPDAGPALCREAVDACDLVRQDCGAGRGCVARRIDGVTRFGCVTAGAGTDVDCASAAECAPGWDCAGGRCVELCCPSEGFEACSVSGAVCVANADGRGGQCLTDRCSVVAQDCGPGNGCYEVSEAVLSCLGSDGDADGAPCVALNDCAAGLGCATDGTCQPYCGPALACGGGEECQTQPGYTYGYCRPPCDPLAGTGCPAQTCYANGPGTSGCYATGTDAVGASCSVLNECQAGLTCVGACRRLCDLRAPSCPTGTCMAIDTWFPWGACI